MAGEVNSVTVMMMMMRRLGSWRLPFHVSLFIRPCGRRPDRSVPILLEVLQQLGVSL